MRICIRLWQVMPQYGNVAANRYGLWCHHQSFKLWAVWLMACKNAPRENRDFEDLISAFDELNRIALIGEPGAGKTTALYKLAQRFADAAEKTSTAPIPLLIPLREWLDANQLLIDFLASKLPELGDHIDDMLADNKAVLLLDGLNEMPVAQQQQKAAQLKSLIDQQKELGIVISCREQDYRDHLRLELDTLLIRPLQPSRIFNFIEQHLIANLGGDEKRGKEEAETAFLDLGGWR